MDYDVLAELLSRSGSSLPPAEIHGGLCGVLCASGKQAAASWLEGLLEECDGDAEMQAALSSGLGTLGDETFAALCGSSLEFNPLLPDDGCTIEARTDALALWCHGFLSGLVIGGLDLSNVTENLSAELDELVRDFAAISKAGADEQEIENPDLSEGSLVELVEYVRVGAQLVFEELASPEPAVQRTLH